MMISWLNVFIAVIFAQDVSARIMPLKFSVVNPIHIHPSRHRRDLSTKEQNGHMLGTSFAFTANKRQYKIDIYLNRGLIGEKFLVGYQVKDGNITMDKSFSEHCYYHGMLSGKPNTTVVLSTCNGLRGTIEDENGKVFGIEPEDLYSEVASQNHIFYNLEDLPKRESKCGVDHEHSHDFNMHDVFDKHTRLRRSLLTETKYVSLVLVNDKRQFVRLKSNLTEAVRRALEIGNHVDSMLKTVKTRAAIVYVETWNIMDLINVKEPAGETLTEMRKYNKDALVHNLLKKGIRRDNVQLITGIDFEGLVVGMAGIGTICGLSSTGVNMDNHANARKTAGTVAHELGHNLGMAHDTPGCSCGGSPCVMAATGGGIPIGFTGCSLTALDRRITDGLASCLFDIPPKLFGPPVCGNDFLEEGEECDCGSVLECNATGAAACCNATTCKLHSSAECAVGSCCKDCKFLKQGTICRKRETECDLEEACNGKSHECPGNFYLEDGVACKNDTAYCFEGGCRTHNEQCEILWGKGAKKAHDYCFRENMDGTKWSSCGENSLKQMIKCAEKDIFCGTVQCKDTPHSFPILGTGDAARYKGVTVIVNGVSTSISCKQGVTSLGPDLDNPTLAQQGTKCGDGKICISHKCVNMSSLDFIKPCPNGTCFNGGVCNNLGHCHCPLGFACPDCKHPGEGGSVDSGHKCYTPATKPQSGLTTLAKSLLILFLGVVPVCIIAIILLYKFRSSLPCRPSSGSNASAQQSRSTAARENNTPDVAFKPQSKSPVSMSQGTHHMSVNKGFSSSPKPANPPPRNPPAVPQSKPVQPSAPRLNPVSPPARASPLPPTRPAGHPPPKPGKLPPLVPQKPR
ncbi:zinc metalloproteinase-disintegrin-like MTP8 [Rhopilema esculentum]|uniref:zinc metalloproteinase-disintegrin-like MTP8 n=1 Tax=Rhopilema esculentum TaxID=499914 RepID=UPI0031DA5412